jgi:hypothetical protein
VWLERVADRAMHGLSGTNVSMLPNVEVGDEKAGSGGLGIVSGSGSLGLGPYGRALEMLEVNRTTWFSVVTQFKALFEENSDIELCSHPPTAILSAWATRQVYQLLNNLQQLLPSIDEGASLRAVLEQTCFFANRMGQVGCDFSSLALPLFRKVLIDRLTGDWKTASAHFKSMLATERFVVEIDDVAREQVIPLYLKQDLPSGDDFVAPPSPAAVSRKNDDVPAPPAVMAYPPLAYFLNSILTGLNFLRQCPMLMAKDTLLSELVAVFMDSCLYFVGLSSDIRTRGAKYLPSGVNGSSGRGKVSTPAGSINGMDDFIRDCFGRIFLPLFFPHFSLLFFSKCFLFTFPSTFTGEDKDVLVSRQPMDKQYALMLAQQLLPHVLVCFDQIFASQVRTSGNQSTETPSKNKGKEKVSTVPLKIESLAVAKESLGPSSYNALANCWSLLRKAELLPVERVSVPTAPFSAPNPNTQSIIPLVLESPSPNHHNPNPNSNPSIILETISELKIDNSENEKNIVETNVAYEEIYRNTADGSETSP